MNTSLHKGVTKSTIILLLFLPMVVLAQQALTLDECFDRVTKNYPLAKQSVLLQNQSKLDLAAINKGKLPQLDANAQATYQSDVTHLPIELPNITVTPPNKDQYKATLDASMLIYNGGLIDATAKVKESSSKVSEQEVAVNLYAIKNQVNEFYLSLLLLQENRSLLEAKERQLQTRLEEVEAGVLYGTILPSSADALQVALLDIKQKFIELDYSKKALIQRLSLLIGSELNEDIILKTPIITVENQNVLQRPELRLFDLKKEQIDFSQQQLTKSKSPKLNAFAQGGYGNPGLNMLDNSFQTFYITGIKLNWNIFDWHKTKKQKQSLEINKEIINTQKETFELNTNLELVQLQSEIDKMQDYIGIDREIIQIRENMVKSAASQLKNGIITSSAYITDFTDLYEAKSNLTLHKTQLLLRQIQYQLTNGTYGNN